MATIYSDRHRALKDLLATAGKTNAGRVPGGLRMVRRGGAGEGWAGGGFVKRVMVKHVIKAGRRTERRANDGPRDRPGNDRCRPRKS